MVCRTLMEGDASSGPFQTLTNVLGGGMTYPRNRKSSYPTVDSNTTVIRVSHCARSHASLDER